MQVLAHDATAAPARHQPRPKRGNAKHGRAQPVNIAEENYFSRHP
jgi:hypothetical protein